MYSSVGFYPTGAYDEFWKDHDELFMKDHDEMALPWKYSRFEDAQGVWLAHFHAIFFSR